MLASPNFGFLATQEPQLALLGTQAERHFSDDPAISLFKIRQFAEFLAKMVAARHRSYGGERETFEELLRRLSLDHILPRETADVFHQLRKLGNAAVHEASADHGQALSALKLARQLGIWFFRVYAKQANFKPGAFQPPPRPVDATAALTAEIEELRRKVAESEDATTRAQREAQEHALARETAEERLRREVEDKEVWARLAEESEAAKNALQARLSSVEEMPPDDVLFAEALPSVLANMAPPHEADLVDAATSARLSVLQAEAEKVPATELDNLLQAGVAAAAQIDLDEVATRERIDQQLRDRGWQADTKKLRYAEGARPAKGQDRAIAEWPTASGPADYALFAGLELVGLVEAKRQRKNVSTAIDQSERYAKSVAAPEGGAFCGGPWGEYRVPFVFASNGRAYLKQVETESGIWFRDTRRDANHRRALVDWPTPQGLLEQLQVDRDAATQALDELPFEFGFPLRDYQKDATKAVEAALAADRRAILLAMATGTGKTKLAIAMLYRLLATKRFRRICFVVDRSALGEQAAGEFTTTKVVSGKAFADIFGLKALKDVAPESDTKVHICTIQGLVKRVLYTADSSEAPPVDQYDLVVVDECHRGYLLDRELSDSELGFRGQDDYISKYRRVLDYFDAVKIGLTATPALHTTEIFGEPVYKYSYRDAVIDGFLIDHEPPFRITTALAKSGIKFEKHEQLELLNTKTGEVDLVHAPDDVSFEVEAFNRKVITTEFNRVVAEELARHIDPALPDKTLIFAATDAHADIVVAEIKKAFAAAYGEIDDAAVRKITGSVDKVQTLIRAFRNDANPKIAVTVDLLTTGIDVPKITNLVFLRRVNSRILYEQMIGRATRLCPEIGKEVFRIFDAVDLYPHLQNLTEMRPVVVNPSIPFAQLIGELVAADKEAERETIREQIAVKLRRRLKKLAPEARARFEALAGETPEDTLERVLAEAPADLAAWFANRKEIGPVLDWQADGDTPSYMPISSHPDALVDVSRGYGTATRPEDFLDGFTAFVRDNVNTIAALKVVVQRPRDLTRADLVALRRAFDLKGYSEANLRTAWSQSRNEEIAAPLIAYIRQAALGDPLVPYARRVEDAMERIRRSRAWTEPQKSWLKRIGEQVAKEIVVDRQAIDREPFRKDGGFNRLNKVFGGELDGVLAAINEELWRRAG